MARSYKCQRCHCSLDPGEGNYCDECLEDMRMEEEQRKYCYVSRETQKEMRALLGMRGA